jgi:hypothetical protein
MNDDTTDLRISPLTPEHAITAVEDDREAYAIRRKDDPNRMTGSV